MVQRMITDYFPRAMNNILINGNVHGSWSLLENTVFYLESKYEPVMVTYEDSSEFVLCCLNLNSGQEVTVHYYHNFFRNRDTVWKVIRGIQIANYLDHPNILELESIGLPIISNTNEENGEKVAGRLFHDVYLVYKSAGFQHLQNFLSSKRSISNMPKIVYQVLNTLKYLHDSIGILHHGLRLRDIFVSADAQNIKVGGFFGCHLIGEEGDILEALKDSCADTREKLCRLAPEELLMCEEFTSSQSIDVWYFGCVLAELILSRSPFTLPDNVVQPTREQQLDHVLAILMPESSEFSFIRCGRCRANLLAKYEESSKNNNPTFLEMINHSCPWAVSLVKDMLLFDPTKRLSIELAIEDVIRTNEGIEQEEFEDELKNMEEVDAANTGEIMEEGENAAITGEVMEEEHYLRMSEFGVCDEQQLREIVWAEMTRFHQRS